MHVRGDVSRAAIAAFLTDATVPVRLACRTPQDNLWMCSLWYRLEGDGSAPASDGTSGESTATSAGGDDSETDGGEITADGDWRLRCATSARADIVSFLESEPGVAFEVSTNDPPYAGVRGRGTATIDPDPEKETLRALIERYLNDTESELARGLLGKDRDEVTITIEPSVVYGWDFSDRMADIE